MLKPTTGPPNAYQFHFISSLRSFIPHQLCICLQHADNSLSTVIRNACQIERDVVDGLLYTHATNFTCVVVLWLSH